MSTNPLRSNPTIFPARNVFAELDSLPIPPTLPVHRPFPSPSNEVRNERANSVSGRETSVERWKEMSRAKVYVSRIATIRHAR